MTFDWINENSRNFLQGGYLKEGVTPEQRIKEIADYAEYILGIDGFSDKFYDYMEKGYYSLSSPVWSNFGTDKGLPISCFGSNIDDNMGNILYAQSEVGMMSKFGGGTSGYFGNLRERGSEITSNGESSGAVHFMKLFEAMIDSVSQGCYDDQTDVLTEKGFMKFEDLMKDKTIKVAQVTDGDEIEYVLPTDYMKFIPSDNELLLFKDSKNIDLLVTKNHNMAFKYEGKKQVNGTRTKHLNPEYRMSSADITPLHRDIKYVHGSTLPSKGRDSGLSDLERLYIATQADGSLVKRTGNKGIKFRFAKKRKSDRIKEILDGTGLEYSYNHYDYSDDTHNIYINAGHVVPKLFEEWVDLKNKSVEWAQDFLEEVSFWDGSSVNEGIKSFSYSSIVESNVDFVQSVASVVGAKSRKSVNNRENDPNKSTIFNLFVSQKSQYFGVEKIEKEAVEYDGYVYCVEVPSHKLIVRRNGHTVVCGNSTRRGRFSPYLPIDHPDIEEFLKIGSEGAPIQDLTHAVTVSDDWMQEMIDGDEDKRAVWAKVIQSRVEKGYPYIFFTDTVNNNTVDVYKDKGLRINHSQLCSEITLPSNSEWSFVCNLSSMNILYYDEWKDTDAVETMIYFLDAVMSEFITKLEGFRDSDKQEHNQAFYFMKRAYKFAKENRALGLGALGWHSYLQSNMIPFDSLDATKLNAWIFRNIQEKAEKASKELADMYGEPEVLKGYERRNSTVTAVAPNTSSAFILGQVSQSIEPKFSNHYVKDLAKSKATISNPYLKKVLQNYGKDTREVWKDISKHDGSVQHLDFLTDHEKQVFQTFSEINQYVIIDQAAIRQQYIDQSQSLNVMINPEKTSAKEINDLYIFAWKNGVKTLYYQHGTNAAQQFSQDKICIMCEA